MAASKGSSTTQKGAGAGKGRGGAGQINRTSKSNAASGKGSAVPPKTSTPKTK